MKIELALIDLPEQDLRGSIDDDELEELADSLRDVGQLQSIGVKQTDRNRYEVVFGARRTRAANLLGWVHINAEIVTEDNRTTADAKKLIENVQRVQLTPLEEAYGLHSLIGEGELDIARLRQQTGKSRTWIKGRLELLDLPDELQAAIQKNLLSVAVAKSLATISNDELRKQYIAYAIENGCTAETASHWANQAQFAEIGMTTMQQSIEQVEAMQNQPDFVEQRWSCFGCHQSKTHREVSMFTLCRACMERVNPQTTAPQHTVTTANAAPQNIVE